MALVDALGNLLRLALMPGQRNDIMGVRPLIDGTAFDALLAVKDARRNDAVVPEPGNKGQHFPVPVRNLVDQRRTVRAPAMRAGHVDLGPGFVDEGHALGVYPALDPVPAIAAADDIGPVLRLGEERLF